ncbi:MAG: class I SAM-dependent methyltransferase [Candidatus Acidiferrales bacterium]
MRRVQLIELHEQGWFPKFLRDEITDTLQNAMNRFGAYAPIVPLLQSVLNSTSSASVIDMCSGGGGPWLDLSRRLQKIAPSSLRILLTDKYPNLAAFQSAGAASQNHITFHSAPVDATKVPPELRGFRTMFTSFHHFEPAEARAILQNAVDAGQAIGIFEVTRRAPVAIVQMLLWALLPFFLTPWIRPFRWSRLLFTYVFPVIPFVLLFDGIVSCLRTYQPQELRELIAEVTPAEYDWDVGERANSSGRVPIAYLIGYPRANVPPA